MSNEEQKTIWILTKHYNLYDQQGGYFSGAFLSKDLAEKSVDHIGRVDYEETWYELDEEPLNQVVPLPL